MSFHHGTSTAKKYTDDFAEMPMSILWPRIITTSPLAKSLATVYTNISASKIAHVDINASFDTSLQIPQANSTPYVPTPTEPQMPGLWLATSSMLEEDSAGAISPHSALLLLEDKETLLKDIEGDNKELAGPLSFFIRELTPTKSLQKLSTRFELLLPDMNLHLPDMQFLARHLIYWRRARAIAPLHIRNIYIVSPNCDLRQLKDATPAFAQRFQALPSLPKMLQLLSAKPIQYGYLIPSHDHKPAYMEILAWLLRGGWVTQLRTFAWVKVTPEIKATVAAQMKRQEKIAKAKKERAERKEKGSMGSDSAPSTMRRKSLPDEESAAESQPSRKSSIQIQSPRLSGLLSPPRPPSDAGSNSSGRTAVHVSQLHMPSPALKPSPLSAVDNLPNSPTDLEEDVASVIAPLDSSGFEQSLVLSPHKANTEESRWLEEVGKSLSDQELREVWPVLCKYFDGRWAFEEIAAREGWKRSRASNLLGRLEKEGVLCVVRHW